MEPAADLRLTEAASYRIIIIAGYKDLRLRQYIIDFIAGAIAILCEHNFCHF